MESFATLEIDVLVQSVRNSGNNELQLRFRATLIQGAWIIFIEVAFTFVIPLESLGASNQMKTVVPPFGNVAITYFYQFCHR